MDYENLDDLFSSVFPEELYTVSRSCPFSVNVSYDEFSIYSFDNYIYGAGDKGVKFVGKPVLKIKLSKFEEFYQEYKASQSLKASWYSGIGFRGASYLLSLSIFLENHGFDTIRESSGEDLFFESERSRFIDFNENDASDTEDNSDNLSWGEAETIVQEVAMRSARSVQLVEPIESVSAEKFLYKEAGRSDDLVVDINFVTNRKKTENDEYFSGERTKTVSYGKAKVSIPYDHKSGRVENPLKIFGYSLKRKRGKHFFVDHIASCQKVNFFDSLCKNSSLKRVFLFIHGFNVKFIDAIYKSAQIKCDFNLEDPLVLFSWPSSGAVVDYSYDKESTLYSRDALLKLISDLSDNGIDEICVIAHSMGSFCLAESLMRADVLPKKLSRLAMAAADIAADSFADSYLDAIRTFFQQVALYVSKSDRALKASKIFNSEVRVGDCSSNVAVYPGVDTIDMSGCDDGVFSLRHSYFTSSNRVLDDLHRYLMDGTPAKGRRLKSIDWRDGLHYYQVKDG